MKKSEDKINSAFGNFQNEKLENVAGVNGAGPPVDRPTPPLVDDWPPRQ